jgi:tetratricopeptide (TPR) repeat protein
VTVSAAALTARAFLEAADAPAVISASSPPGSGHARFVRELLAACAAGSYPLVRLALTLEGFEPGGPGRQGFVRFLSRQGGGLASGPLAALTEVARRADDAGAPADSFAWAIALALVAASPAPARVLDRWRAHELEGVHGWASADGVLDAALSEDANGAHVLIDVSPLTTLPDPACAWLMDGLRRNPSAAALFRSTRPDAHGPAGGVARGWCRPLALELPGRSPPGASDRAPPVPGGIAGDFLAGVALCGGTAPVRPLLRALGVDEDLLDEAEDAIDAWACEGEVAPFEDLGFAHPGFPGLAAVRMVDEDLRGRVLDALEPPTLGAFAEALRRALGARLAVETRGAAELYAAIGDATAAGGGGPRQRLRLWVGVSEAPDLARLLAEDLRRGTVGRETLRTTARTEGPLSPVQRLAFVDALGAEALATDELVRARLLVQLGRHEDARGAAERGLALGAEPDVLPAGARGELHLIVGNAHRAAGRGGPAIEAFRLAEEAARANPGGPDPHALGASLAEQGLCHAEARDWPRAIALLRAAAQCLRGVEDRTGALAGELGRLERNLVFCHRELTRSVARSP